MNMIMTVPAITSLLLVISIKDSHSTDTTACFTIRMLNKTFCIPEQTFQQLTNPLYKEKETWKIKREKQNLPRTNKSRLQLVKSAINRLTKSLREDRRSTHTRNTWVEESPGTFKSELVEYPQNHLAMSLKKLLAIKQAKENREKKAKLAHA